MAARIKWSAEDRLTILVLWLEGRSMARVAIRFKVSRQTIYNVLKREMEVGYTAAQIKAHRELLRERALWSTER